VSGEQRPAEGQDGGASALYEQLLGAIGRRFDHIASRQSAHMRCASGCHSCCAPGLSVSLVEARALAAHLAARPERAREALALEVSDPHAGQRCSLLSARGECVVYEARPLVCRTHGAPLLVPVEALEPRARGEGAQGEEALALTACELNFTEEGALEGLTEGEWMDVRQLDRALALLSARAAQGGVGQAASARWPLRASALLGEGGPCEPLDAQKGREER
jgi:Fe-S-cluster containining protein